MGNSKVRIVEVDVSVVGLENGHDSKTVFTAAWIGRTIDD